MRRLPRLALLLAVACVTQQAREVQTGVVGLADEDLLRCMGPPDNFDYARGASAESRALWLYVRPLNEVAQEVEIQGDIYGAETHGRRGPTVLAGDVDRLDTVGDRANAPRGLTRPDPGWCVIHFALDARVVTELRARGRTVFDVNADTECLLLARSCLPE